MHLFFSTQVLSICIISAQLQVPVSWKIMMDIHILLLFFVDEVTNKQRMAVMMKCNAIVTTILEVEQL
jgi:hypothetical protein